MPDKVAVVLFQLGGPASTDAVEPFLFNLFMDPDIIDFPLAFLARRPLARFISRRRARFVAENYRMIGGKSPILDLTMSQSVALEARLRASGIDATTFVAMRYSPPLTTSVVREIRGGGFDRIILLPLYPQLSQATTLSSVHEWQRECDRQGLRQTAELICCYPNEPLFVEAVKGRIDETLQRFGTTAPEEITLVFSAHGVPGSYIKRGDPYQLQVEETVRSVVERGAWRSPHVLCYQSRVGPAKWLQPSLVETMHRLAHEGRRHLLIIPIAFVTDHIETLHEINIEVRREAAALGVVQFEVMPGLNDDPRFISALTSLVQARLGHADVVRTCSLLWSGNADRPRPFQCPQISPL